MSLPYTAQDVTTKGFCYFLLVAVNTLLLKQQVGTEPATYMGSVCFHLTSGAKCGILVMHNYIIMICICIIIRLTFIDLRMVVHAVLCNYGKFRSTISISI